MALSTSIGTAVHTALFSAIAALFDGEDVAVVAGPLAADQTWPAVHVGDVTTRADDAIGFNRSYRTVQVTVFSEFPGPAEVLDILGTIRTGLHGSPLTLSAGEGIMVTVDRERTQLDADGLTYIGTCWVEVETVP